MGWSPIQRSPTDGGVAFCVWSRHLKDETAVARVGLLRQIYIIYILNNWKHNTGNEYASIKGGS
jgi:hypothetical protein